MQRWNRQVGWVIYGEVEAAGAQGSAVPNNAKIQNTENSLGPFHTTCSLVAPPLNIVYSGLHRDRSTPQFDCISSGASGLSIFPRPQLIWARPERRLLPSRLLLKLTFQALERVFQLAHKLLLRPMGPSVVGAELGLIVSAALSTD